MTEENVVKLNIDLLMPNPYQPRKAFNENSLKELALSIREYGVLNPILVRPKQDKYEIIAGERRTRASKLLNLETIPAIIMNIDDDKMAELALIENIQRENITPIEEAMTYQTILKKTNKTEKELSEIVGRSQPYIANKLRLLTLPENIKDALINKKISERHARSLLTIKDETKQTSLLEKIINEKLTVKELDVIIKKEKINADEINSNVDNIMNSLDSNENKKEEKESDNMNNGNFFPNFNNTVDANNNQASLNSMNMQTMNNGFTYQPEQNNVQEQQQLQGTVAPVVPAMPESNPQPPVENSFNNVAPMAPLSNGDSGVSTSNINPIMPNIENSMVTPELNNQLPTPEPNQMMANIPEPPVIEEQNQTPDIPLFNNPDITPAVAPIVAEQPPVEVMPSMTPLPPEPVAPLLQPEVVTPAMPEQSIQPIETPLFNSELATSNTEIMPSETVTAPVENNFEVPVATESVDRFAEVSKLLSDNGVQYKAYSNETGHCIIIEL